MSFDDKGKLIRYYITSKILIKREEDYNMENRTENTITVTVGQKKATNFSKEAFDANESVTLTGTTPEEAGLLRKIIRIKLMGTIVFDMIAFDSMVSESLLPEDVTTMVTISKHQLAGISDIIKDRDNHSTYPNKDILASHVLVAGGIVSDIEEQLG